MKKKSVTASRSPQLVSEDLTPKKVVRALGRNRTCDLWFRKPSLYPLSYEGRG